MAQFVQVLSLLSRVGALSVLPSVRSNGCRFASRGVISRGWTGHVHRDRASNREELSDEELELEDVDDKLQALVDEGRKRQRTVKFHILRRQMTPPGPPQRKLTWDAIQQIRYLKQEQPEEWTVERLAEGFSVSPDVIRRVLRSKFVPLPERRDKQDAQVMAGLSQQVLPSGAGTQQDRLKLLGNRTEAILPSGSAEGALVTVSDQTHVIRGESSVVLAKNPVLVTALPAQFTAGVSKDAMTTRSTENTSTADTNSTEEDEESWDGRVLTEEEVEELMGIEKPSPVVQVGKDFFDAEGNFLFRI